MSQKEGGCHRTVTPSETAQRPCGIGRRTGFGPHQFRKLTGLLVKECPLFRKILDVDLG